MKTRELMLVGLTILIVGCASRLKVEAVQDLADVGPDEGLLLLVLHSPNESDTRFFFRGRSGSVETPGMGLGSHSQLLVLPADDYEMTSLYVGTIRLEAEDFLNFRIEPGKITYPGDIRMDGLSFNVLDMTGIRVNELLKDEPALADWPIVAASDIVENRRNRTDGARRVPNTQGRIRRDDG